MEATPFDPQPTLHGPTLTLRPLQTADFEPLYHVASDPLLWEQHPHRLRYQRPVFEAFFAGALESGSTLVVGERATGQLIGCSRYYDWDAATRAVAIGFTFLARSHWGGTTNRELKHLMLTHAFRWATGVWFHVGPDNQRSRRAVEKLGGQYEHQGIKLMFGQPEEFVFYKIKAADYLPTLRRTDSTNPDFRQLVTQLDRYLTGQNGEADAFYAHFNQIDSIRQAVVAYVGGVPVGCGAIKPYGPGVAEVKRMYVDPAYRGRGIAGRVLAELEQWSRELGVTACVLETARGFDDALRLYTRHGYQPMPNYGPYVGVENSVCLRKAL